MSCSKDETRKSVIKERSLDLQVLEAYQEGMNFLEELDTLILQTQPQIKDMMVLI